MSDRLKKLTKNEITVLYWKCKGLKYPQIALRLGYSVDWVQLHMSNVYSKLGFEKSMHWTKRVEILEKDICPLVPDKIDNWETTEEPEVVTPDPEMMSLVLYDEKQIEEVTNSSLIPPKPKETIIIKEQSKGVQTLRRFIFALIAAIIMSLLGIFIYNLGRGATPAPEIIVITATPIPATETPVDTLTPIFTQTSLPTFTFTPPPTFTPLPTATEFIPPADGILFQDDFESGDLSAWTQYSGNWFVANGELTMLGNDGDYYEWIGLNRPEWKNYVLSVKIKIPFQGSASQEYPAIAVRNNKGDANILGVVIDSRSDIYWAFVGTDQFDTESIAGKNYQTDFESGSTVEIEVQGDTYILRVNAREVQRITIGGFNSGGISLGIMCYNDCPTFDNVKVIYLP